MNKRITENQLIESLQVLFESKHIGRVGIGDDAAILENGQIISTDAMVEGVHFLKDHVDWADIAYKLFASNASDIAAMGGQVTAYTLTLSIPESWKDIDIKTFFNGVKSFLNEFPADLVGGDTVFSKQFFASVTVFGYVKHPWLRSSAQVGNFIYCTGTLGDSRLWLNKILNTSPLPLANENYFKNRHYRPTPRLKWVSFLRQYSITAAMDISDGLIEDLQKLCKSSQTSFCIEAESLPLSEEQIGIANLQEHHKFYLQNALVGGEDYELLFTSPELITETNTDIKITRIGRILSQKDDSFIILDNKRMFPNNFKGYEHR